MRKYTKEGLPVVTQDTVRVFGKSMKEYYKLPEWLERIKQENPVIYDNITGLTKFYPQNLREGILLDLAGLYTILRRQAESNKMEEALKSR